jgi:hypothetical protein
MPNTNCSTCGSCVDRGRAIVIRHEQKSGQPQKPTLFLCDDCASDADVYHVEEADDYNEDDWA